MRDVGVCVCVCVGVCVRDVGMLVCVGVCACLCMVSRCTLAVRLYLVTYLGVSSQWEAVYVGHSDASDGLGCD